MNLEELVTQLKSDGYTVTRIAVIDYVGYWVTGKWIKGAMCEVNDESYRQLSGRIALDNAKCFDKFSTCPLIMTLPVDYELLKAEMNFLRSKEGYEHSNSYEFYENPRLTMQYP